MSGIILLFLVIFLSDDGEDFEISMGSFLFANYIHLFEIILMLEQFLPSSSFTRDEILLLKNHEEAIFNLYKDTVNQKIGMGDNLLKIHLLCHMADDIYNIGPPICFDTASGENRHKYSVKIPASKTQHQNETFYEQIGKRVTENLVIERAYQDIEIPLEQLKQFTLQGLSPNYLRNQIYHATKSSIEKKNQKNKYEFVPWKNQDMYKRFMDMFSNHIFPYTNQKEILIYTEYVVGTNDTQSSLFYRANLEYKSGSWNDWVYIQKENNCLVPAKILMFFEIKQWNGNLIDGYNHDITGPGKYAFCNLIDDYYIADNEDRNISKF